MKQRNLILPLVALTLALPVGAALGQEGERPRGMALLQAVEKQPIGIDQKAVKRFLDEIESKLPQNKERWKAFWDHHYLLMTPAHERRTPGFWMGKYEVSNAQWATFLADPANQKSTVTQERADTLAAFASAAWGGGRELEGADRQRAWLYLLELNRDVLMEHLNPDGAEGWDPLFAQAGDKQLPYELELKYTRYLPPSFWKNKQEPPEDERGRPVREISWEMALDFCLWAGMHLPTEFEWERAVRGPEGRRFAWGDDWNPLALVWGGYNRALKAAESPPAGAEPIGRNPEPDRPMPVDSFQLGATPDGIHHLQGNVTEWVMNKVQSYEGSKTSFHYDGVAIGARGGNYQDAVEVLLAADRTWDGPSGPLRPRDALEGFGFRPAMYTVPGADLALPVAMRYDDAAHIAVRGPPMWRPIPIGLDAKMRAKRSSYAHLKGFAPMRTAGVIKRQFAQGDVQDHVYVTGRAKGIALLPVKGFPQRSVSKKGDLARLAKSEDEAALLGVLLGTEGLKVKIGIPTGKFDKKGRPKLEKAELDLHDERFYAEDHSLLANWKYVGAFLVLRPEGVAVMGPDPGNSGNPTNYLRHGEPIGYLLERHVGGWEKTRGSLVGIGSVNGRGSAALTISIPPGPESAKSAKSAKGRPAYAVRLTLEIPVVGW
jgi:formylglycine-generating enzyme required for sulfatase activity